MNEFNNLNTIYMFGDGVPLVSRPLGDKITCMANNYDDATVYFEYFDANSRLRQGSCARADWFKHVI